MKFATLISVLLLAFSTFMMADNPGLALESGLALVEEARTTLGEKALTDAANHFSRLTKTESSNGDNFYYLARVDAYWADFYDNRHDKKNAERSIDDAIAAVLKALSLNDKSGEFHSLLADLYGRKIGYAGMFGGMRYGPKADAEIKKALALDASNSHAYACLGRKYLFAPKMFGGDVNKSVESFQKAIQLAPNFDENFVWLSIAYRKQGDKENADKALQEALRLNPRSEFAKRTLAQK